MKPVFVGLATLVAIGAGICAFAYTRYGGGVDYPDLSTAPRFAESDLEQVLSHPDPLGNLAVHPDGRLFFTVHPESRPEGNKLFVFDGQETRPFPSPEKNVELFDAVMGVNIDRQGRVWTIDHGQHGFKTARLLAFDAGTGEVVHDYAFDADVAPKGSFIQAMQVDSKGRYVYLADVSFFGKQPGIVVYDSHERKAWRMLDKHPSVLPMDYIVNNPVKRMVFFGGLVALKPGVDGVALTRDDATLYYAAMTNDTLFSVPTSFLNDPANASVDATPFVKAVGRKPLNDGMATDDEGNIYITDVEHRGVALMKPTGELETLVNSPRIRWADSLSFGPDGWLYVIDSAIPDQMLRSKSHMKEAAPYFIYRFKPGHTAPAGQ